jgi:hypothetical protein
MPGHVRGSASRNARCCRSWVRRSLYSRLRTTRVRRDATRGYVVDRNVLERRSTTTKFDWRWVRIRERLGPRFTGASGVQLKDAYIVSGITGEAKRLMIYLGPNEKVLLTEIYPIPPGANIQLGVDLNPSLSIKDFVDKWGKLYFKSEYAGIKYEKLYDEDYIVPLLRTFPNSQLGPRVTKKPQDQ